MQIRIGLRQGVCAGPVLGALTGIADCLRAGIEGGTILGPRDWPVIVAWYALCWLPLGLAAGLVSGIAFRRPARATVLLTVIGSGFFFYGAYRNIFEFPAFAAPESLRFDAILSVASVAVFVALYRLRVPVPEPSPRAWIAIGAVPVLLSLGGTLVARAQPSPRVPVTLLGGTSPNVVVVLADSLRFDHLGAGGGARPTSPRFDAFAGSAVFFSNCRAAASWTKPACASLFTGLLPSAHSVLGHEHALAREAVTLAEVFQSAGYRTVAFSDNPVLCPEFGFGQGFERFDVSGASPFVNGTLLGRTLFALRVISVDGGHVRNDQPRCLGMKELSRRLFEWVDAGDTARPFFAYVHAMETHMPYDAPPPFRGRFQDPAYIGPQRTLPPPFAGFLPFDRVAPLPESERRNLEDRYDEGILEWDEAFGELLDGLDRRRLLKDAIVVVVADHGEEFYEHGAFDHGQSLFEELLHVPLAIRAPGLRPARIEWAVRATDFFPTLLSLAGLAAEAPPYARDLSKAIRNGVSLTTEPVVSEVVRGSAGARSVVLGDRKLILAHRGSQVRKLVFDLAADPGESHPIEDAEWEKGLAIRLGEILDQARAGALRSSSRRITEAEREAFRGLGYFR